MSNSRRQKRNKRLIRNTIAPLLEDRVLLSSAKIASSKAVRSSRALGITIKAIKSHEIVEISPDKSIKVIRKISRPTIDISTLKKGMILERKKICRKKD